MCVNICVWISHDLPIRDGGFDLQDWWLNHRDGQQFGMPYKDRWENVQPILRI